MTIDEVIKILGEIQRDCDIRQYDDGANALKLGIEALKNLKDIRDRESWVSYKLLPGETED